jgi:hypothetical protein
MSTPKGLEVFMNNGLLRFYFVFMLVALALFSCENNNLTQESSEALHKSIQRKPESRHPVEPNEAPVEGQKSKKTPRRLYSRSSNWC